MDQLIVFDAKSPANDDLSNFPKYIKTQTENLKKYAKHDNVKKDLFLVIPSKEKVTFFKKSTIWEAQLCDRSHMMTRLKISF